MGLLYSRPLAPDSLPTFASNPLSQSSTPSNQPDYQSRHYVSILAWFSIFLGLLDLMGGRVLGLLFMATGAIGAYASWDNIYPRLSYLLTYLTLNFFWMTIEFAFFLLLLCAKSDYLTNVIVGVFSYQVFPAFGKELAQLLAILKQHGGAFLMFSMITKLVFDVMILVFGFRLYKEALLGGMSGAGAPLLTRHASYGSQGGQGGARGSPRYRPGLGNVSGLGATGSPGRSGRHDRGRSQHPFQGRGYRLGDG